MLYNIYVISWCRCRANNCKLPVTFLNQNCNVADKRSTLFLIYLFSYINCRHLMSILTALVVHGLTSYSFLLSFSQPSRFMGSSTNNETGVHSSNHIQEVSYQHCNRLPFRTVSSPLPAYIVIPRNITHYCEGLTRFLERMFPMFYSPFFCLFRNLLLGTWMCKMLPATISPPTFMPNHSSPKTSPWTTAITLLVQ